MIQKIECEKKLNWFTAFRNDLNMHIQSRNVWVIGSKTLKFGVKTKVKIRRDR